MVTYMVPLLRISRPSADPSPISDISAPSLSLAVPGSTNEPMRILSFVAQFQEHHGAQHRRKGGNGQSGEVSLLIEPRMLAVYDNEAKRWIVEEADYDFALSVDAPPYARPRESACAPAGLLDPARSFRDRV